MHFQSPYSVVRCCNVVKVAVESVVHHLATGTFGTSIGTVLLFG